MAELPVKRTLFSWWRYLATALKVLFVVLLVALFVTVGYGGTSAWLAAALAWLLATLVSGAIDQEDGRQE